MRITENEFLDLVEGNQGLIHKVCNTYCDDNEDYKDLFQEIMLQLWQSFGGFKGESKPTTWMYRVALYTAIGRLKKEKNERKKRMALSEPEVYDPIEETYKLEGLKLAIHGLSEIDKALVTLYLDEKSYQEIADILGISENNVGVKLNRIKKRLKEKLIL